jgi:aminodeoxychorismate synthase component I
MHIPVWIETDLPHPAGGRCALHGEDASLVVEGDASDWPRLAEALERHQHRGEPRSPLPDGAAIGYVTYEGRFWFAFYPDTRTSPAESWRAGSGGFRAGAPVSRPGREAYCEGVRRVQEFIRAGDIYQLNLTREVSVPFSGDPRALFTRLRAISPAPFAACLELPHLTLVSSSPELFLRLSGREIVTRPIKGTRPRHRDPVRDEQLAFELIASPKERAELVMITDLERNDLGQICEYGSVVVERLCHRESFAQVHHLMSTVRGWLRPGVSHADAFRACFPGGSITGAPKRRAMEIIASLEGRPRGPYCGAIGWFGFNGESQFNIAIRTLVVANGTASFGVGSGITADSDPEAEYKETCHKAAGMLRALASESTPAQVPAR